MTLEELEASSARIPKPTPFWFWLAYRRGERAGIERAAKWCRDNEKASRDAAGIGTSKLAKENRAEADTFGVAAGHIELMRYLPDYQPPAQAGEG